MVGNEFTRYGDNTEIVLILCRAMLIREEVEWMLCSDEWVCKIIT